MAMEWQNHCQLAALKIVMAFLGRHLTFYYNQLVLKILLVICIESILSLTLKMQRNENLLIMRFVCPLLKNKELQIRVKDLYFNC